MQKRHEQEWSKLRNGEKVDRPELEHFFFEFLGKEINHFDVNN
jgi:hypothetical protein